MVRSAHSRTARLAGVAVLPAALLLCCAGRAGADCGDYVRVVGPDGRVQTPGGHDPMPGERPCQGPNCTGGPKAPAPIPPAPSTSIPDVKGLVTTVSQPGGTESARAPADDSGGLPTRQPQSIFHPPRAS